MKTILPLIESAQTIGPGSAKRIVATVMYGFYHAGCGIIAKQTEVL
jgi:hypothetical protein